MIRSFRHKGLAELWERGRSKRVPAELTAKVQDRLSALDQARALRDLDVPGYRTHPLRGPKPLRYSMWVSGAWRITFEWEDGNALRVDLAQYH